MGYEFDATKDKANRITHGLGLADFDGFDSEPVVLVDDRFTYGETRFRAFGYIDGKGYCLVYTIRGSNLRLISFRRAHEKEMKRHD